MCAAVFIYPEVFILNIAYLTKATIIAFKSFLVYVTADTNFKAIYQTNDFVQYYNKDMIVCTWFSSKGFDDWW